MNAKAMTAYAQSKPALLVAFLLPAAFLMHNYWAESDAMMKANQMAHFWKDVTLAAAAVLYAVAHHRGAL